LTKPLSIETDRLQIRWLHAEDAEFIYHLVNDPDWIRFIGNKNVSNLDEARTYLETGPLVMYQEQGFGLNRVALKADNVPVGLCGLLKRESIDDIELGFAFLPEHRNQGYAYEAASAVLENGRTVHHLSRLAAILAVDNIPSRHLLKKLGFEFKKSFHMEPNADILDLYLMDL